jgi:multicomponent Na+:H+ antiporter subunit A
VIFALLISFAVCGGVVMVVGGPLRQAVYGVAALPFLATLAWLLARRGDFAAGIDETVTWVPAIGLDLELRVDGLGALMLVLVAGIGGLVVAYSARYFDRPPTRLLGLLVLFGGSMAGIVVADNLIVIYGFWELTSITSFLLIGDRHRDAEARAAALQALLITGIGGLAMLTGFVIIGVQSGTYRLSDILADPPGGATTGVALVLVLLGAFTKSAQYPFQSWLPAAMVAPTPVSTYLHAATMVKAGVYLVARLAPAFAADLGWWRPVVVGVGAVTMIVGALRALGQTDLKLLLALGTVSQLGFMTAVFGWGTPQAAVAGGVMLLAHGAFKAAAFMAVGILDRQHGTRDVRELPRAEPGWAPTAVATVIAAASMAGVPLLLGFVSKESAFQAFTDEGGGGAIALAAVVAGSALTAAYSYRFAAGALGWGRRASGPHAGPPPLLSFAAPAVLLSAVTVVLGVWPGTVDGVVDASGRALASLVEPVHLALWHGLNLPLALSAVALAGGAVVVVAARWWPAGAARRHLPSTADGYRVSVRGLNTLANRVTAISQPGSLPLYLGVILLTAAVVPGALMLTGTWWSGWPQLIEIPAHVPLAASLVAAALAATVVRTRFAGALLLGLTGYVMAGLFVAQGAPDLALTQVAIETLTTVLFVLVLRRLPDRFEWRRARVRRSLRVAVAAVVGLAAFGLTMAVGPLDPPTQVAQDMVDDALPEGDGRNVVNVILVDFRGLDTLGEITVLTAAAIGTVALARAGRRPRGVPAPTAEGERLPPPVLLTRLVTIDVSVRIVFAAVMVGSIWLLFAGHNQPGGGFVGGIVAGAALALRYAQGGLREVRKLSRGRPWIVLGTGLLIAVGTAIAPTLAGRPVLEGGALDLDLPVLGATKLTSALIFDIGVYLAVIGLAMMVFESFGDDSRLELPAGREDG